MPLSITTTIRSAGTVVLLLRGQMRRADVDAFRSTLAGLLRAHRPREIQLDCSALAHIDPSAATAVNSAVRDAARDGSTTTITLTSPTVRQQLCLAGAEDLLG